MSNSLKPGGVVDGQQIFDGSHVLAADFDQRLFYYGNGTTIGLDFSQGILNDGSGNHSVNMDAHQLIASDGSTVVLDWSDPAAITVFSGAFTIAYSDGTTDLTGYGVSSPVDGHLFARTTTAGWRPTVDDDKIASNDGNTYFDNSGFHGDGSALTGVVPAVGSLGSVIAGTKTATGTATTTFTVTIGVTMANTTYKVTTGGDNALSSAVHYVNNKTTTTFDIVYLAGLTGAVSIDWIVTP